MSGSPCEAHHSRTLCAVWSLLRRWPTFQTTISSRCSPRSSPTPVALGRRSLSTVLATWRSGRKAARRRPPRVLRRAALRRPVPRVRLCGPAAGGARLLPRRHRRRPGSRHRPGRRRPPRRGAAARAREARGRHRAEPAQDHRLSGPGSLARVGPRVGSADRTRSEQRATRRTGAGRRRARRGSGPRPGRGPQGLAARRAPAFDRRGGRAAARCASGTSCARACSMASRSTSSARCTACTAPRWRAGWSPRTRRSPGAPRVPSRAPLGLEGNDLEGVFRLVESQFDLSWSVLAGTQGMRTSDSGVGGPSKTAPTARDRRKSSATAPLTFPATTAAALRLGSNPRPEYPRCTSSPLRSSPSSPSPPGLAELRLARGAQGRGGRRRDRGRARQQPRGLALVLLVQAPAPDRGAHRGDPEAPRLRRSADGAPGAGPSGPSSSRRCRPGWRATASTSWSGHPPTSSPRASPPERRASGPRRRPLAERGKTRLSLVAQCDAGVAARVLRAGARRPRSSTSSSRSSRRTTARAPPRWPRR